MFDVVLGIDPGVSRCGYGAVSRDGSRFTATTCGVIRTPPSDPLPDRLAMLAAELDALIAETRPVAIAVERVLFQVNARTAMSVGQASGLALAIAGREHIPVVQYSPNEVKLAVAGDGGADKREVADMVAGGVFPCGTERFESILNSGVPYVLSLGAIPFNES